MAVGARPLSGNSLARAARSPYNYRTRPANPAATHRKEVAMQNDRTRGNNVIGGAPTFPVVA